MPYPAGHHARLLVVSERVCSRPTSVSASGSTVHASTAFSFSSSSPSLTGKRRLHSLAPRRWDQSHPHQQLRHESSTAPLSAAPPWRPAATLDEWVKKEARPISLKQLTFFGRTLTTERLISSANYIRQELPTRLAHRLRDMQTLPYVVVSNPHIAHVYERYYAAFEMFRRVPYINTTADNDAFCKIVHRTLEEHLTVIPSMAMGMLECQSYLTPEATDRFMNNMLRARISRRVIAEQHLALTQTLHEQSRTAVAGGKAAGQQSSEPSFVGEVFLKCRAAEVVERCAHVVTNISRQAYGQDARIPEVRLKGHLDATFPYILSHLEYIIGEILRNSFSATFERHGNKGSSEMPPIEVLIVEAPQHVIFRFSDQGGGIPRDILSTLWSFGKGPRTKTRLENLSHVPKMAATMQELDPQVVGPGGAQSQTQSEQDQHQDQNQNQESSRPPQSSPSSSSSSSSPSSSSKRDSSLTSLASRPPGLRLGMGLPMSRVYAEYWAGSLTLQNMTGYGTDAFLQISKLGNKNEQLSTRASMDAL